MEEQFTSLVLGSAAVAAAIGDRFWPSIGKQGTEEPYAIYQLISSSTDYGMRGATGYVQSRMQIDAYGKTYAQTKRAARALKSALSGYRGGIFQGIFVDGERDLSDRDSTISTAERLYRVSIDFMIHHTGE